MTICRSERRSRILPHMATQKTAPRRSDARVLSRCTRFPHATGTERADAHHGRGGKVAGPAGGSRPAPAAGGARSCHTERHSACRCPAPTRVPVEVSEFDPASLFGGREVYVGRADYCDACEGDLV